MADPIYLPGIAWEILASSEIEDRRRADRLLEQQATEQLAAQVADISFAHPNLPGGVVTAAGMVGLDPMGPEMNALTQAQLRNDAKHETEQKPGIFDRGYSILKGASRGLFATFGSLYDEVVKGGTSYLVGIGRGLSHDEAVEGSFGFSAGAVALREARAGREVNLGEGWLPGGTLSEETQARIDAGIDFQTAIKNAGQEELGLPAMQFGEAEAEARALKVGTGEQAVRITPGRAIASTVIEPGERGFNTISGLIDFGSNIFLDPANAVTGGIGKLGKMNRLLVPDGAPRVALARGVGEWFQSDHGSRVIRFLAENDDYATTYGMMRRSSKKAVVDTGLARQITETKDASEIQEMIRNAVESGHINQLVSPQSLLGRAVGSSGFAGFAARAFGRGGQVTDVAGLRQTIARNHMNETFLGRWSAEVGARTLVATDVDRSVEDFGQWLKAAGFKQDRVSHHMMEMSRVQTGAGDQMFSVVSAAVREFRQDLVASGVPEMAAAAFTKMFDEYNDYRKYWVNNAGNAQMFPGSRYKFVAGGKLFTLNSAHMMSEFMDQAIPLLDIRKVRDALRRKSWAQHAPEGLAGLAGKRLRKDGNWMQDLTDWNDLGPGAISKLGDTFMSKFWKPLVLLRVAWPVRVLSEEAVRQLAAGYGSPLTHPVHAIAQMLGLSDDSKAFDVLGNAFDMDEAHARAMARNGNTLGAPGRTVYRNEYVTQRAGDPRHVEGWAVALQKASNDPITTRMLDMLFGSDDVPPATLDEIKEAFWNGELKDLRTRLTGDGRRWEALMNRPDADGYIDSLYARVHHATGGDFIFYDRATGIWRDSFGEQIALDDPRIPAGGVGIDGRAPTPDRDAIEAFGTDDQYRAIHAGREGTPGESFGQTGLMRDRGLTGDEATYNLMNANPTGRFPVVPVSKGVAPEGVTFTGASTDAAGTTYEWVLAMEGHQVGVMRVTAKDGKIVDIPALQVATDSDYQALDNLGFRKLINAVLESNLLDVDSQDVVDLMFGGLPLREWLGAAGNFNDSFTVRQMMEAMREIYGPGWSDNFEEIVGRLPAIETTPQGARALAGYVRGEVRRNAHEWPQSQVQYVVTREGSSELLDAVRLGELKGVGVRRRALPGEAEKVAGVDELAAILDDYRDYAPAVTTVAAKADPSTVSAWDQAVGSMFNMLMSVPTNKLSRSPVFREAYWKRLGEMIPFMDDATATAAIKAAKENGIGRTQLVDYVKAMFKGSDATEEALTRLAKGGGFKDLRSGVATLKSLEDADEVAKAFALEETQRLLYDLSKSRNFFDMTRLIFPFGEAWFEIISTWSRLVVENPAILRRGQQAVEGARKSGFFYDDPATGEQVFNYPGLGMFFDQPESETPLEANPQFTGRVEGLNLALSSFLPGFGPLVQMPAASMGADFLAHPDMKPLREVLFPYGTPDMGAPSDAVQSLLPAWFRKAAVAIGEPKGDDLRLFNNTVIDVMRAMQVNGEIRDDPNMTPTQRRAQFTEALETAKSRARKIYAIRAFSQFAGPTGAGIRWDIENDEDGTVLAYQVYATEYRRLLDENDGDQSKAFDVFVERFGFDPAGLITAKSVGVVPRSVTEPGLAYQTQNEELFEQYPLTAYYSRPDGPSEQFDYGAYISQLRTGVREERTPEEWEVARNQMLGQIAYDKARSGLGAMSSQPIGQAWLRTTRMQLMEEYPGYGYSGFGPQRADPDQVRAEFETWADDPVLSQTSAGRGLAEYLRLRDQALAQARIMGVSEQGFATAEKTAMLREWLRREAERIAKDPRYVSFAPIFDRWYASEVDRPSDEIPTTFMGVDFTSGGDE